MSWFFFALLAATIYSGSILCDKLILTRYFDEISELSLTTAAALAGIPLLIVFYALVGHLPSARTFLTGFIAGWLMLGAFQLYYVALRKNDASLVTTLFQLILFFNFIFGLTLFHENVSSLQIIGLIVITISSVVISLEQKESKWVLKKDVLLLMAGASLLASLSDVVFKVGGETQSFIQLSLAEYTSTVTAGLLLFIIFKNVRTELRSIRKVIKKTVGFLEFNEILTLSGTLSIRFAIISGPIALVQGVMGAQPFIVLGMSVILATIGVHGVVLKKHTRRTLLIELSAMFAVCIGSALISGAMS